MCYHGLIHYEACRHTKRYIRGCRQYNTRLNAARQEDQKHTTTRDPATGAGAPFIAPVQPTKGDARRKVSDLKIRKANEVAKDAQHAVWRDGNQRVETSRENAESYMSHTMRSPVYDQEGGVYARYNDVRKGPATALIDYHAGSHQSPETAREDQAHRRRMMMYSTMGNPYEDVCDGSRALSVYSERRDQVREIMSAGGRPANRVRASSVYSSPVLRLQTPRCGADASSASLPLRTPVIPARPRAAYSRSPRHVLQRSNRMGNDQSLASMSYPHTSSFYSPITPFTPRPSTSITESNTSKPLRKPRRQPQPLKLQKSNFDALKVPGESDSSSWPFGVSREHGAQQPSGRVVKKEKEYSAANSSSSWISPSSEPNPVHDPTPDLDAETPLELRVEHSATIESLVKPCAPSGNLSHSINNISVPYACRDCREVFRSREKEQNDMLRSFMKDRDARYTQKRQASRVVFQMPRNQNSCTFNSSSEHAEARRKKQDLERRGLNRDGTRVRDSAEILLLLSEEDREKRIIEGRNRRGGKCYGGSLLQPSIITTVANSTDKRDVGARAEEKVGMARAQKRYSERARNSNAKLGCTMTPVIRGSESQHSVRTEDAALSETLIGSGGHSVDWTGVNALGIQDLTATGEGDDPHERQQSDVLPSKKPTAARGKVTGAMGWFKRR